MLERCSRADKAVAAAVAEVYANGVSARKVERIAQRMGIERLSSSQVSRVCKRLDAEVAALRAREFGMAMPYLFLDAAYVKCRRAVRARSAAVVTAIAVGGGGVRRVVGPSIIGAETYAGWLGFCRDLRTGQAPLSPLEASRNHPSPGPDRKDPGSPWCDNASRGYASRTRRRTPGVPDAVR